MDWDQLNGQAELKKEELRTALQIQTLYSEIVETQTLIIEKTGILKTVEEVGTDLASVISLQRKLNSIERDIAALQNKLQYLQESAAKISEERPEDAETIDGKLTDLMTCWGDLSTMVKQRNETLAESGELKRFVMDLDEFHNWLQKTQAACASEDIAQSLQEAEALLDAHFEVKGIIDQHQDDFDRLCEDGPKFSQDESDLQQQALKQQLDDIIAGWRELDLLWVRRKNLLEQSMNYQIFLRDAKQAEALLAFQELFISKHEVAPVVDVVLDQIKKHEDFLSKMDQHDDKVNHVVNLADQLVEKDHYATDKIKDKTGSIKERRRVNRENIMIKLEKLRADLKLKQFLQDTDDVTHWLNDRLKVASEEPHQELTNLRSKLTKHQAFEMELQANKQKIESINEDGKQLIEENTENSPEVESRLETIDNLWSELNTASVAKSEALTEAHRKEEFNTEVSNVDTYIKEIETTIVETEKETNLTSVKAQFTRHKILEKEIREKRQRMLELSQAPGDEVDGDKLAEERRIVEERFEALEAPLAERRIELEEAFNFYQFQRDIQDEHLWIDEKEPVLQAQNFGSTLHEVLGLKKRHQNLCMEIEGHEPIITALCVNGEEMANGEHPRGEEIQELKDGLVEHLDKLKDLSQNYQTKLDESLLARQYFHDAAEAESWMSEQELYMIGDDRGKDENAAQSLLNKHINLEKAVEDFQEDIDDLRRRSEELVAAEHPESSLIESTQRDLEKEYAELKELAEDRHSKLDENLKLYQFNREVEDLETWINEKEVVAGVQDIGQDFDHVQMLEQRFDRFSQETQRIGIERVESVNAIADQLIGSGHSDAATISEWKVGLNDSWTNLLELIETRKQLLAGAHEYHRFFQEARQTLSMIQEKESQLGEDLGRDQQSVYALQRYHRAFEADLQPLGNQVAEIQNFASELKPHYAGDREQEIENKESQVLDAWSNLLARVSERGSKLGDSDELQRFLLQIQDLLIWIRDMRQEIASDERPKFSKRWTLIIEKTGILKTVEEVGTDLASVISLQRKLNSIERDIAALQNKASVAKSEALTEAHRKEEFNTEVSNVDTYIKEIETTIVETEKETNLTSVKAQFTRHKILEKEIREKRQRMLELSQAPGDEVDGDKLAEERRIVEERFEALEAPLAERRIELEEAFNFYQFQRDIQDEHLWIDEKEPVLQAQNFGSTLHEVLGLKKRHQNLCMEIEGHEPIITALCVNGEEMANGEHPRGEEIQELKDGLVEHLDKLKDLSQNYQTKLDESLLARQYFHDAAEAESWMSEQELYMIGDDRGKDENAAQSLLNKHINLEKAVEDFQEDIDDLRRRSEELVAAEHPESSLIESTQRDLEKEYAELKELAEDRHSKLDENLKLYQFNREVEDLETWINEKEVVAGVQDIGQDFDHVQMLEQRFDRFSQETQRIGIERVESVNAIADQLIGSGHSDAATISEWKVGLNDSWTNLLELIETRKQLLAGAHEYHRFFQEARQTLSMIQEKESQLGEDLGRDQQSVYALQRYHRAFEADLQPLGNQVAEIQNFASELKPHYAGDREQEIENKESQVLDAWSNLLARVSERGSKLGDSDELQRFLLQIQDLLIWIRDMRQEIASDERPKVIPECQAIMNEHQGRKAEIDAREEKIAFVLATGEKMIEMQHFASNEIQSKINELREKKSLMESDWAEHWDILNITLEVMHFVRDAHLAEEWIFKEDLNVGGKDQGDSLEIIEKLLEKQSAFEKLLATQEERFLQLENLTTFELRQLRRRQLEQAKREKEEQERLERQRQEQEKIEAERELQRMLEEQQRQAAEEEERARSMVNGELSNELDVSAEAASAVEELMKEADVTFNESEVSVTDGEQWRAPVEKTVIGTSDIKMTGYLARKHTMEGSHKKASQRTWKQYFVSLRDNELKFHREENDFKNGIEPVQVFDTIDSRCEVASDYHKKKNVFRIKFASGQEYLLQAKAADELSLWIQHIRGSAIKSGHLPEDLSPKKDKRGSKLFSLKKK
eukprot:gene13447-4319_t